MPTVMQLTNRVKFVTDDKYNQCVSCVIQEKVVTLHLLKQRTIRGVAQLVSAQKAYIP